MAWLIIFTAFAAWGLLCALWAALGWLLPGSGRTALVLFCPRGDPEAVLTRIRWMRSLGLLQGQLVAAGVEPGQREKLEKQFHDIEFWDLAEVSARLEAERERLD